MRDASYRRFVYKRSEPSVEACAFGERAAGALGCGPAAWPAIAEVWARGYDRDGALVSEEELRTKIAFNHAWNKWRGAARALAAAGGEHFGPNWAQVAADLDSNRIRISDGTDPRDKPR